MYYTLSQIMGTLSVCLLKFVAIISAPNGWTTFKFGVWLTYTVSRVTCCQISTSCSMGLLPFFTIWTNKENFHHKQLPMYGLISIHIDGTYIVSNCGCSLTSTSCFVGLSHFSLYIKIWTLNGWNDFKFGLWTHIVGACVVTYFG